MTRFAASLTLGLLLLTSALGQRLGSSATSSSPTPIQTTISISGVVVGDDGSVIGGAQVYAGTLPSVKLNAPPTRLAKVVGSAVAGANGSFTISNLPNGSYVLCAQTSVPGWLDPCHWASSVPTVSLSSGANPAGQRVVMAKGAVIQIRINDPGKLLPMQTGTIVHDVEAVAQGSNRAYYNARITSTDAGGRNMQVTLPFNSAHTLIVRSQRFALNDSTGVAVPALGHSQGFQASASAALPQFTFTVAGKAH